MSKLVLVTGGSGYIGRALSRRLAADGWAVRAAARKPHPELNGPGIEYAPLGDLERPVDWRPLLQGASHVVHLAGIAHSDITGRDGVYEVVNAQATRDLALAARNAEVERMVLVSSVRAQSGPAAARILKESDPPAPTDAYGRSKLLAEQFITDALSGSATEWVVLRPAAVYGKGVPGNFRKLEQLARSSLPLGLAGLTGRRSIVGLASAVSAISHALASQRCRRATFLIADDGPVTVPEIVATLRRAMGRNPHLFSLPNAPLRAALRLTGHGATWDRLAGDLIVDTTAIRQTGWSPVKTTADGLADWIRSEVRTLAAPRNVDCRPV